MSCDPCHIAFVAAKPLRVIIADDHRMVAEGIGRLLSPEFEIVSLVHDGETLLDQARKLNPDVIVSEINVPVRDGIEVLKALRAEGNTTRFVILTMRPEPGLAAAALRAGANGYVLKVSAGDELVEALRRTTHGGAYVTTKIGVGYLRGRLYEFPELTPKQNEVLKLVVKGHRSQQIADIMGISRRTVEAHRYVIMQVLDVHSSLDLVRTAKRLGLVV